MRLSQASTFLLVFSSIADKALASASTTSKSRKSKSRKSKMSKTSRGTCALDKMPINVEDFKEPDWETIIELAFPPWKSPKDGCPTLDKVGGTLINGTFPTPEANKWNPCYYTKGFAGLNPDLGGYPTPIDTHYPYEFAAPFWGQPGDGSVKHCSDPDRGQDIGACPKLGTDCGAGVKDCATITDDYGIGHIPPFVPLAAIKNAYGTCGTEDICKDWFHYETHGCNIKKSVLDELVYEYFGDGNQIKFEPPIILKDTGKPSSTYFRLEYGGEPAGDDAVFKGPHYCTKAVDDQPIWGDFCPYVHTGEHSGQYRHPHIALAALELWIANQCMPDKCAAKWLDSPNGVDYAEDPLKSTSITWAEMKNNTDPISQPQVPYVWPNSGSGDYPGLELYPAGNGCASKPASGSYVTAIAGTGTGVDCP